MTESITLLPHQVFALKDLLIKRDQYEKISQTDEPFDVKLHNLVKVRATDSSIIDHLNQLLLNNSDSTIRDKTVGEIASLYNLHLYKGGFVSDTSDSLYTGNLTGTEIVDKVTKINDEGYIFLKLKDGRTVVIIGDK